MSKEREMTIVLTTHYMEEADSLCDRVAIIDQGKIIVMDSPDSLKEKVGGDIVYLTTKVSNIDKFREMKEVSKIEKKDNCIILTVKNASEHLQEILEISGKVERVEVRSASLEDVFINYTGKEIRAETGEGGIAQRIIRERTVR